MNHGVQAFCITYLRNAERVSSSEQGGKRGPTDGLSVEIGKAHSLSRHFIQVWRLDERRTKAADIIIALIIGEDNDEIGAYLFLRWRHRRRRSGQVEGIGIS